MALEDLEGKSLSSEEIVQLQAQEATRLKKFLPNKKGLPTAKGIAELPWTSPLMESMEPSYQAVIDHMKRIRAREIIQGEIIRATCKKLGKCKPKDLVAAIDRLEESR